MMSVMTTRTNLLEHVINHSPFDVSDELARYLLSFSFPASDQARFDHLSEKAQAGTLSEEERAELEEFLDTNDFLAIVQAKARAALAKHSSAA
jgi:hypothetical protein